MTVFVLNSILLGIGLAMDAFSVSIANSLNEPGMKDSKMCGIAGTFAGFQFLMPLLGWFLVHTVSELFTAFQKFIPWIALILLAFIGGKMVIEGIRGQSEEEPAPAVGPGALLVQGVATSIDALSVGFTISEYDLFMAFSASLIIAAVTFVICIGGLKLGKTVGNALNGKASVLGGLILIGIGLEIFIKGVFF